MNRPCPDMQDRIADYVLGALDAPEAEVLREHLSGCSDCRQYLQRLEGQTQALVEFGREIDVGTAARQARVIDALQEVVPAGSRTGAVLPSLGGLAKTAVAAVLLLGAGITIGHWTAPRPVDIGQLRAELESSIAASLKPAMQEAIVAQMDQRLQAGLSANDAKLRADLGRQIHEDLCLLAAQFRSDSEELVRARFTEMVDLIEAARRTDHERVAKAFDQIRTQTGRGLYNLAVRASDSATNAQN